MNVLDMFLQEESDVAITDEDGFLTEGVKSSKVSRSKMSKIKAAGGLASLRMAKETKDPLYVKYHMFRDKALELKRRLMKKYGRKGMANAKKSMM